MARPKKVKPEEHTITLAEMPTHVDKPKKAGAAATITFTGDPRGGKDPAVAEYGGKSFPKGEPVTVDDAGWLAINANIRKNSHFRVE
jgi:hypothetical protein